jgi:hypothetical protein
MPFRYDRRWLVVTLSFILVSGLTPVTAQTDNQAGVVIQYADGRVATYCVRFDEPSINGVELLTRVGLSVIGEFSGQGAAVCSINGEGCAYPAQPCFCRCQGADCAYWNYYHLLDGAWRYSPIAASAYMIENGAVDAWMWGNGDEPPSYTVDQICSAAPVVAPTDTIAPAATDAATIEPTTEPIALVTSTMLIEPTATTVQSTPIGETPSAIPEASPEPVALEAGTASVSDAVDAGSYVMLGVIVVVLGGWLVVSRLRK